MASQDDLKEAMRDIHKYSHLIGLEGQELLHSWVKHLALAGKGSVQDHGKALDYARYLAYQLQRRQLRFPFARPPFEGELPDLKELLFGADSDSRAAADPDLSMGCHAAGFRSKGERGPTPTDPLQGDSFARALAPARPDVSWDSHRKMRDEASDWDWESHIEDPKGERNIRGQLEDLAEDAPLWLLLSRVCEHTRDGGALLQAVVAEELAEWSARLAAEQTMAVRGEQDDDPDDDADEGWGPRADRRADYWHEVGEAWKRLNKEDPKAAELLSVEMGAWLSHQDGQLQAEQVQMEGLADELREIHKQVVQSQRWKEVQFGAQNQALMTETAALKERICKHKTTLEDLKLKWREPNAYGSPPIEIKKRS